MYILQLSSIALEFGGSDYVVPLLCLGPQACTVGQLDIDD
jgi:hypothetical protein